MFWESLKELGGGLWDAGKGLATSLGDLVGLDGKFGLGGADKAFSLANMGDALGGILGTGDPAKKALDIGVAGQNPAAAQGLFGMSNKDLLTVGGNLYSGIQGAKYAKQSLANQSALTNASLAEQARQVDKEQKAQTAWDQGYTSSLAR